MKAAALTVLLAGCTQSVTLGARWGDAGAGSPEVLAVDVVTADDGRDVTIARDAPDPDAAPDMTWERVRLYRCHGSNGEGCANPDGDWDHCFSTSATTCQCVDAPGSTALDWVPDGVSLSVYKLPAGAADTVRFGGETFEKLYGCYDPAIAERRYVLWDHTIRQQARLDCRPVGFVTRRATAMGDAEPVRETYLPVVTDRFYALASHTDSPERVCGASTPRVVWWAWP
jgi:hypothetical protein